VTESAKRARPLGLAATDRVLGLLVRATSVLVLPVSLLLFLQWPLREWVQAFSREANDLAQVLFGVYVALAVTAATRRNAHLAADALARRYKPDTRARLARVAALTVLLPWALFLLWSAWPIVIQSLRQLEAFPDTFSPGYFLLKLAVALLALGVALQAVISAFRPTGAEDA
jgi:TRAP-type mannitol/chloroaromatic compound transport system permease small subunit